MYDAISYKILQALKRSKVLRFSDLKAIVKNPRTLTIKLKKLQRLGLVRKGSEGYRLTERGLRVEKLLEELDEALKEPGFEVRNVERIPHAYLAPVIKRYCEMLRDLLGDRLISVMLFGSVARGDWDKDSDIDILVVAEGWRGKPVWERIKELRKAINSLEQTPEYLEAVRMGYWPVVQNYPLSPEEARRFKRIYLDAIIDGIILYDRDGFLEAVLRSLRRRLEEMGSHRVVLPNRRFYWVLKRLRAGEVIALE